MKDYAKVQKYLIILLLIMSSTIVTAQLTRQQAINKVLNEIVIADTGNINVYSAYTLKNQFDTISLNFDTILLCPYNYNWVFFVDDHPSAGWEHPCRYVFVDSITGNFQIVNEKQYPKCFRYPECVEYETVMQVYYPTPAVLPPNQSTTNTTITVNENLYAVIIGTEDISGPNRFWKNTSLIYNTLIEAGYSDENIYVHYNYDGRSYSNNNHCWDLNDPSDNDNHIDYPATESRIIETFENLEGSSTSDLDLHKLGPSDQLFVYVTGHGGYSGGESFIYCRDENDLYYTYLKDYELKEAIDEMECAQMYFLFQQCKSGNFANELTYLPGTGVDCENRVVHTATSSDLLSTCEKYITEKSYGEFTYYWAAAVRGVYPVTETPWEPSYAVGSFQFHDISFPTNHPVDYDPDLNSDGFVTLEEAFWYADDWDTWSEGHPDNPEPEGYYYDDPYCWDCEEEPQIQSSMGCNSITTIYGLAGTVDDYTEIIGNRNYLVGETVTVDDYLDILDNATLYFSGENALIIVNPGGELVLFDGVTTYDSEIIVDGEIEINDRATFNNTDLIIVGEFDVGDDAEFNDMELHLTNENLQTTFNKSTFYQSSFHNYGEGLTINNSAFNNCFVANSHRGNVLVTNTVFDRTWLYLENISAQEDFLATVSNCDFTTNNGMVAIEVSSYDRFFISNNLIDGNYYNGIQLVNSGDGSCGQVIFENEITNCVAAALMVYNSTTSIAGNNIHHNNYGIKLLNNSNTDIIGDPDANTSSESQQIRDNDSYEIYASGGSFPWYLNHNVITDDNQILPLVYYDYGTTHIPLDVRYNCWGCDFMPSLDLYPSEDYIYSPTWCPGGGSMILEAAETLYLSGKSLYDSSDYTSAKSTFEMVINQYPETKYASASMKDLFTVEKFVTNDYGALQQYYNTNTVIQADTVLMELSVFLANKCDVEMEYWESAIEHYEDIILAPESTQDSIFAIIDLGHVYFLMDNSSSKSMKTTGNLLEHKPKSRDEYYDKRNYLLSLLPFTKEKEDNNVSFSEDNILLQNVPNPFANSTTISFRLTENSRGNIKVINNIGEVVRENNFSKNAGLHNIELDMRNLPVGIYYYTLTVNGNHTDTKKMVVVR